MKLDRLQTALASVPPRAMPGHAARGAAIGAGHPEPALNRLLSCLCGSDDQAWLQRLEYVALPQSRVMYEVGDPIGHVYFPLSGLLSLTSTTENGETIEVAMIGREGMIGLPIVMDVDRAPSTVRVLSPTRALRANADVLRREFRRGAALHDGLLRYLHGLLSQMSQAALCYRFHTVHQRLCRWLLAADDRLGSDPLEITQECVAHLIGSLRTSVTAAALALQDAGAIRCRRGRIRILDRPQLEAMTCECYRIVRDEMDARVPPGPGESNTRR
jgi:CRP-like cAMP-binding protein